MGVWWTFWWCKLQQPSHWWNVSRNEAQVKLGFAFKWGCMHSLCCWDSHFPLWSCVRKRFLLTLALCSQAFAKKLKPAFHQGTGQKATSFPPTFVLHIPSSLLMWIDTGQGEHLGKLYLYVLHWKYLVVTSRVRAYWPLSHENSTNELVTLNHIRWMMW